MKHLAPLVILLAVTCAATSVVHAADEDGFVPLFNGKDLTGWKRVTTAPSTWTVKDGVLHCSGKPIGELRTERMYQNFILELEWRHMKPRGNAGVFIWADDITAKGQPFHRSIEVQVLENAYGHRPGSFTTHGDIFPIHGSRMRPLTGANAEKNRASGRAFPTEHRSKPSPEWNHYRIVCNDGSIALSVNGKEVTRGADASPRKGYICLESEGGVVEYRNIRIKELPDTPVTPDHVATADRGYRALYLGVDLTNFNAPADSPWTSRDWVLAATAPGTIETSESFKDFGFIFDARLDKKNPTPATIHLRGAKTPAIVIDTKNKLFGSHIAKPGAWSRFEGELRDGKLTLHINGAKVLDGHPMTNLPDEGPIRVDASGPIDLANIFVRP